MIREIKIKGASRTLLLGYQTLRTITGLANSKSGNLDFDDFETIALEGIKSGAKAKQEECNLTIEDIREAFEQDMDLALEVQAVIEVFISSHSEKRQKLLKELTKAKK